MNGTNIIQTWAMVLMPPKVTEAVSILMAMPTIHVGTPKVSLASSAIEFACTVQPMPNDARAVKTANMMASHFMFRPRSRAYIGPP